MNHLNSRDTKADSVHRDWIGWLPEPRQHAFDQYANELEARYLMLSVVLDEAISLHNRGSELKAIQNISIVPALCERLSCYLQGLLSSLETHVKCGALFPSVAWLNPAHFLRRRDKYLARKSSLLSNVLLTQRSGYMLKSNMLREMVCYLQDDLCDSAEELVAGGATIGYPKLWIGMDTGHFDLNTCLRESLIMLRCFLRVLPDNQVLDFEKTMALEMAAPRTPRAALRAVSPVLENTTSA